MTPATIIREAQADGGKLALSPAGTIKATGDGAAVNRWLVVIRERKAEIIDALKVGAGGTAIAAIPAIQGNAPCHHLSRPESGLLSNELLVPSLSLSRQP